MKQKLINYFYDDPKADLTTLYVSVFGTITFIVCLIIRLIIL